MVAGCVCFVFLGFDWFYLCSLIFVGLLFAVSGFSFVYLLFLLLFMTFWLFDVVCLCGSLCLGLLLGTSICFDFDLLCLLDCFRFCARNFGCLGYTLICLRFFVVLVV